MWQFQEEWSPKIKIAWKKFSEDDGGVLSERWYYYDYTQNTVKVFYWRYQLNNCGLPIGRTWETVVLTLEE